MDRLPIDPPVSAARRSRPTARRRPRTRRGVALLMVLSVVSVASILGWAMLSASSLRSQVDGNAADATEAQSIADSGVGYALYCLEHPERTSNTRTNAFGDTYYYGDSNLPLWNGARGTSKIEVSPGARYAYAIRVAAQVNGVSRIVEADVTLVRKSPPIVTAASFNGTFRVPNSMRITGPANARGAITNASGRVDGPIMSSANHVAPTNPQVTLLIETNRSDRTYTYKGETYVAQRAPTTITGNPALRPRSDGTNPCNVWYVDDEDVDVVTLRNATFTGVLVVHGSTDLRYEGTNAVTAPSGMPALVVNDDIDIGSTHGLLGLLGVPAKLHVTGAVYVGDDVIATDANPSDATFRVDGALVMGGDTPSFGSVAARIDVNYVPAHVKRVDNLSTQRTVQGVDVARWQSAD